MTRPTGSTAASNGAATALNIIVAAASFCDDLGSMSDESLGVADPALLASYRDDAARIRDSLLRAHDVLRGSDIVSDPLPVEQVTQIVERILTESSIQELALTTLQAQLVEAISRVNRSR